MPYSKVDTSKLSGYALEYVLARQGGATDAEAHVRANAATGGSGLTMDDVYRITSGTGSKQTFTSNPYNPNYVSSPYDYSGYHYYTEQQRPQNSALQGQIAELMAQMQQQQKEYQQRLQEAEQERQGQIAELMAQMERQQKEYQQRLQEAEQERLRRQQLAQRLSSPEYLSQMAQQMTEYMSPAMQQMQNEAMKKILQASEARGFTHSGIVPALQQKAANELSAYFANRGLDIASEAINRALASQSDEAEQLSRQLGMELAAMESGRNFNWRTISDMLDYIQRANEIDRSYELSKAGMLLPYTAMTRSEQANFIIRLLEIMGQMPGEFSPFEIEEIRKELFGW